MFSALFFPLLWSFYWYQRHSLAE